MTAPRLPALAISGSNSGGGAPYSCAVATAAGIRSAAASAPGADLAVLVADTCGAAGLRAADLRELRLDLGPGSYTGLRTAVTFARFLQLGTNLPILATDTLALIAAAAAPRTDAPIVPLLDGRRGRLHAARCRWQSGTLVTTDAPMALPAERLGAFLRAGDAVVATADVLALARAAGAHELVSRPMPEVRAAHLFTPGLPLQAVGAGQLEPLYLMGSYAEGAPPGA